MSYFNKKSAHIVIVGAGISGLSTAVSLFEKGFSNIIILEARERIGGRMHSIKTDDFIFEAGAQWLQKGLEATFEKLSSTIKLCDYPMKMMCFHEEYKQLLNADLDFVKNANEKFSEIYDQADDSSVSTVCNDRMSYTYTEWRKYFQNSKFADKKLIEELFFNNCCHYRTDEGCNSLADVAVHSGYKKIGDETFVINGSFSVLFQTLRGFLPADCIKCQHIVKKIQWHQTGLIDQAVKITYSDKETYTHELLADHVIVTVPLGVLKRHHKDLFEPALPEEKVISINRLAFGIVNKIVLYYEKSFWEEGANKIFFIWKDQDKSNRPWWKTIVTIHIVPDFANQKYYLVIFISGKEALELEQEDPVNVGRICSEIFQKFLCLQELPVPKFTYVSKWGNDPFSYGSYSYIAVGSSSKHCTTLSQPLTFGDDNCPKILFAGEATHADYLSTIHGGYFSGKREAERLETFYLK